MERKNLLTVLILFIGFLWSFSTYAQDIESGKVYMLHNAGKTSNSMALSASSPAIVGSATNKADLKQQWFIEPGAEGFYIRNVSNGGYLTSPKKTSAQWSISYVSSPVDDTMLMVFESREGNLVLRPLSQTGYSYAHNDASNNVVCWEPSNINTQWRAEEIPMSNDEINQMLKRFESIGGELAKESDYQICLDALFTDKSCTKLKVNANKLSSNSYYRQLPQVLKSMADKIAAETTDKENWKEINEEVEWDGKYAYKYRVQNYEPYSEGASAANMVGIQAYTNMNNPTGIYANAGEFIYVMVNDPVPDGATLYIGGVPDTGMYNNVTAGIPLKQGLNMILSNSDLNHFFIYYTVATTDNKKPYLGRELSKFSPVTIHIEGGHLNGFFNYIGDELYSPDTKEDFEYTTQRAKHPMYDLLGKYVILHFYLEDTPNVEGGEKQICVKNAFSEKNSAKEHDDPVVTMKAWDEMCFAERILMGIQSDEDIKDSFNQNMYESIIKESFRTAEYTSPDVPYSDYFNNRMMGITYQAANLYMNATAWRTAYAPGTLSAILSQFPEQGIWGPAHEYGHMNQGPIAIAGTTEESNNIFSNVANYFVCKTTSRTDYPEEQLKHFNAGDTYLQNGTWGTTRMFWQLWCYYHAAGKNKKFYPRLFEILCRNPLKREINPEGKLLGSKDMLHFAKMCCIAAQEDLTNFFASWGFFSPQDTYHIDDYSVYDLLVTQEDIDAVKAEIQALNLKKNDAIILIDDRVNSSLPNGFGYDPAKCGEYGGISDFLQNKRPNGELEYVVEGNIVTVSGSGEAGVGFLVFDENGELIGFSNSNSFILSDEAAQALMNGKATLVAVGADSSQMRIIDPVKEGSIERKIELLLELIAKCDELLDQKDESLTHVGMLIPEACKELTDERNRIAESLEEYADNTDYLTQNYLSLYAAYYSLLMDENSRIKWEANGIYRFINHYYPAYALDTDGEKLSATEYQESEDEVPATQQWILQPVSNDDNSNFYLKNLGNGKYISTSRQMSAGIATSETPVLYNIVTIEPSVYAMAPDNDTRFGLHIDAGKNVVQWYTSSSASHWDMYKMGSVKDEENPVSEITLIGDKPTIDVAEGPQIVKVIFLPEDADIPELKWETDDSSVLGIAPMSEAEAKITPLKPGDVTLTVSLVDNPEISDSKFISVVSLAGIDSSFVDRSSKIDVLNIKGHLIIKSGEIEELKKLEPGIYILRQGSETREIMIR